MHQRMPQRRDSRSSTQFNIRVWIDPATLPLPLPKESQRRVRIPPAMPHPFAEENILPRKAVAVEFRIAQVALHFLLQLGRQALIRVQVQNPWTRSMFSGEV